MQIEYAKESTLTVFHKTALKKFSIQLHSGCRIYAYSSCFVYFYMFVKNQIGKVVYLWTEVIGFGLVGVFKLTFFIFLPCSFGLKHFSDFFKSLSDVTH